MKTYISTWPQDATLPDFPRTLSILGSTGSIGVSALTMVRRHPDLFRVVALTGGRNVARLAEQATEFRPALLVVLEPEAALELRSLLPQDYQPEILHGPQGFETAAALPEADVILSAIVGAAGFPPTLAAALAGKVIALANKESLVLGGHVIRDACRSTGALILPVDSEHNALFQGLCGHAGEDLHKLILTASGGPFRGRTRAELEQVTLEQALKHPNWAMGAKITIDSSTLMNKGLEFIEACHLYGLPPAQVDVVVHPQSIVHSLVEYVDGSQLAHMGLPDMQVPIAHCLCFPRRVELGLPRLNLAKAGTLTFEAPDMDAFPCLRLAREAYEAGAGHCVVLNAANEVAVERFLNREIGYLDIPVTIEAALNDFSGAPTGTAEELLHLDAATRTALRNQ